MKIPKLRILVTSFCEKKCVYCRPTGEGTPDCMESSLVDYNKALKVCELYKNNGGTEIKISGGEPVFWPMLVPFVRNLKSKVQIPRIELITRSPKVLELVNDLKEAGLDSIKFSLDTLDVDLYRVITGSDDYNEYIQAIKECATILPVKINMVVMKGVNYDSIFNIIKFCETNNITRLKLLDIIDDLQGSYQGNADCLKLLGVEKLKDLFISLEDLSKIIATKAVKSSLVVNKGGLGYPVNEHKMPSGLVITFKNSENGAWYSTICKSCGNYPCHDALMALRYTSTNKLQFCLLNEQVSVSLADLDDIGIANAFSSVMRIYSNAFFIQ